MTKNAILYFYNQRKRKDFIMFWYIELNGNILPTPYRTMRDALDAIKELEKSLGCGIYDVVLK